MADCPVCSKECGSVIQPVECGSCSDGKIDIPDLEVPKPEDGFKEIEIPKVEKVTTEDVDGTGVFDIYMRAGMNQLMTQYEAGRIKGSDFAQAYVAQTQLMMTEANKFVLGVVQAEIAARLFTQQYLGLQYETLSKMYSSVKMKSEADLVCAQVKELTANGAQDRSLKAAQTTAQCKTVELYDRQIAGFDEKNQNDIFKTIMDSWAVQGVDITSNQDNSEVSDLQEGPIGYLVKSSTVGTGLKLNDGSAGN